MLVVTRKAGERILIPESGITISVVRVLQNGQVRIGISAPENVGVFREELLSGGAKSAASACEKQANKSQGG